MKKVQRFIAAGLAVAMMMPVFTSCRRRGGGAKIESNDPWYNVSSVIVGDEIDSTKFEYASLIYAGLYEDKYVFRLTGQNKLPSGFDYSNDDISPYTVNEVRIYDESGECTQTIDVQAAMSPLTRDGGSCYVRDVIINDDNSYVEVQFTDYENNINQRYRAVLDLSEGTMGPLTEYIQTEDYATRLTASGGSDEGEITFGGYRIRKFWFGGKDTASYVLEVIDPQEMVTEFDLRSLFPQASITDISHIIDIGNNRGVICASCYDGYQFFIIDFTTMTIEQDMGDMTWLSGSASEFAKVQGLGTIVRSNDGLYSVNYENRSLDPLFIYANANVNIFEISRLTPMTVTTDKAVFSGSVYNPMPSADAVTVNTVIYTFTRAESNPNVGKTIISVASVEDYSYALCSAICEFNESSSDYFAELSQKYIAPPEDASADGDGSQDSTATADSQAADLGNQLAIDIMSGTGPDIIINGSQFGMLNDDDYLMDLGEFVSQTCGADAYFTNVFESSKDEEQLFHVPVSFHVRGIITDSMYVDDGQVGFTYDQYADFVSGPCNGNNPINQGRMYFFINSLNCMPDLIYDGNHVTFDSEAFRSLAEFTEANINEVLTVDDEEMPYSDEQPVASVVDIENIASYFNMVKFGSKVFLGIPTYDARGPILIGSDSVAISAQTRCLDACKDFVSILLGDSIQRLYGLQSGVPVNRAAFGSCGSDYISYQNESRDRILAMGYFSESDLMNMFGINPEPMDPSVISDFETFIGGLDGWYYNDGAVNSIIREELPAYFEGQKTLDQVIPILEARVQTLLNERG